MLIKRARRRDSWRTHAWGGSDLPEATWPHVASVACGGAGSPFVSHTHSADHRGSLSPGPGWPPTSSWLRWRAPPTCPPRPTRRGFLGRPPRPLSWLRWGLPGPGWRLKRCRGGREGRERSVEAQRGERGPGPAALARRQPVKVPVPRKMGAGASPPKVDGGRTPGPETPWSSAALASVYSWTCPQPCVCHTGPPSADHWRSRPRGLRGASRGRGTEAQQVGPVHRVKG